MKNRSIVIIIAALCMVIMGACFSSWDGSGDEGTIVINLGNGGARYVGVGPGEETAGEGPAAVEYTIILTSPGGEIISGQFKDTTTVSFSVQPGFWTVAVRVNDEGALQSYGETSVEVQAGETVPALIKMRDLITVKGDWKDLKTAIEGAQAAELVMLTSETLIVNDSIEIPNGRSITLLAKNPVTIIKGGTFTNSMFRVPRGSSLTLGVAGGMEENGEITFNGNNNGDSSLIYVGTTRINSGSNTGDGGKLTMYDGVILTNNRATISDRGGAVVVQGGTFIMNGGTISGNTAVQGGGVRVLSGTFTKTGGTIYGSNGDENKNTATSGNGHAVYFDVDRISKNETLGPDDNL